MHTDMQPVQETWSIKQKAQLTQQERDPPNVGYKLIMQYYDKLTGIPSLVNLTSYFVAANIISSFDGDAIKNIVATKSQTAALRKLFTRILTVSHNNHKPFYKMLRIMQIHGHSVIKRLATEMLEKFVELFLSASTDTGMYVHIHKYKITLLDCLANYVCIVFIHLCR